MRRALVVLAVVAVAFSSMGALRKVGGGGRDSHGVMSLPPYDADNDGDPDGNPVNPSVGDVWRNGAPGCNRVMVYDAGGVQCAGDAPCPLECF